jgi:2-haloacid dehalogenase
VPEALSRLRGIRLAILSNGSPAMLEPLVLNSGLHGMIGDVLSVDLEKTYKPAPRVYRLAVDRLGVPAKAIGFVSSNCWDAIGARSFGFRTFWVNRGGAPVDEMGVRPDHELSSLAELPGFVS